MPELVTRIKYIILTAVISSFFCGQIKAQINTEQVLRVGQNSLYLEDYVLSIQYFNQVIAAKPYLAQPYFYRAIAKLSLDDYLGAEADASLAIEKNPFITNAYEVRGVARQNLGRHREAIEDYTTALEQLPESKGILFNKALAEEEIKDYEASEKSYAELLRIYPRYDNGYVGRARLRLATGDTIAAVDDINKALELNKNAVNAYIMRADIAIKSSGDYKSALADMDEAIKLQPQYAGFFINRAFLRYNLDDYFGAMADYDYAIQLEPLNATALFNRGLLRAEVHDNNKAIDDFSKVLQLDTDNYHALYNRALLYKDIADYRSSITDLDRVIEAYPGFAGAYFVRSEAKRLMGDTGSAEKDYRKSMALSKLPVADDASDESVAKGTETPETQQDVANRFTSLLTIDNNATVKEEYSTAGIKGRVQDRNMAVEIEPMFTLSYYVTSTELKEAPYYIKEIDEINGTRMLRFIVMVTNREPQLTDEDAIAKHFASIEYYTSYISTHSPRAIDYFGRAMDYCTLHNYQAAINDLDKAIELTPDFVLAYLLRANARLKLAEVESMSHNKTNAGVPGLVKRTEQMVRTEVLDDINRVIELSPRMAFAYYNKGNLLVGAGDYTSAISAYTKAIELKPDLGEAFYNRGYLYLKLGNRDAGVTDLSKAGELGIVPSYNLLKRMTR
ncbi:MAG TPA: tetratricopeptide repeat protein [Muribaculum sp.]|jgi:tetratricopeptide (TPR) repeat protein|uniref:tetratricopeptide repeat protein n=1 Tax=Heminiphilus faecis TaxID=2601703 RepID=UPI000EF591DD|nr:tetratricopeptide repeat protein [Heminiphilus faecis]RLT76984.1 tetratricopeptide repeat protein [bacterium J10(2018)]HRF68513.1 tetratricopeptide repeat protein [Muribaculum sp.]